MALGLGIGLAIGAGSVEGPAVWLPGFFNQDFWKNVVAGLLVLTLLDIPLTVLIVQRIVELQNARSLNSAWLRGSKLSRAYFRRAIAEAGASLSSFIYDIERFEDTRNQGHWAPMPGVDTDNRVIRLQDLARKFSEEVAVAAQILRGDVPEGPQELLASLQQSAQSLVSLSRDYDPRHMARPDWWLTEVGLQSRRTQQHLDALRTLMDQWRARVPELQLEGGPLTHAI